ncbi:MAG: ribulose-phosphate 3-epimerase [Clostridia bacterium]|nr:ribulose-phosphate 3-epimerase [Clostridia bacterium]
MKYILSPSLLSADFTALDREIKVCEDNNVAYLHIDVMDGMFVPNISIGIPVVKSIRKITDLVLDVHLMIVKPERYIKAFAEAGSDIINIHYEATEDHIGVLKEIKKLGKKAAVTIKPNTSYKDIISLSDYVDMFLVMSVEPGFGGQSFIESTLKNVEGLAEYRENNGLSYDIEIDGGINADNITSPLDAGANIIVAGSAVFGKGDTAEKIRKLNGIIDKYNK